MPLPQWLGRLNRVGFNRGIRLVAGRLPGLGIVEHRGRRSGRRYRTPVNVFRRDGGFAVALTYGPRTDWVKNVLAAGAAQITTRGRSYEVVRPRVITDRGRAAVPWPVRRTLAVLNVDQFLLVDTETDTDTL
jgi:deazaflavin-dependent oxidoreductase (nitroreductase family)